MNVLVLSAVLPYPLLSGGQVRLYNLLQRLSQKHSIYLLAYIREESERSLLNKMSFCKKVDTVFRGKAVSPTYIINSLLSNKPLLMTSYDLHESRKKVLSMIKDHAIDIVHIEPGYTWLGAGELSIPTVVAEHNIEHTIYEDYIQKYSFFRYLPVFTHDVKKLKQWEQTIWKKADSIIAVSDQDKIYIEKHTHKRVDVVPNGIDEDWFHFKQKKTIPKSFSGVYIGDFRWIQNRDAVKELLSTIWPHIKKNHPTATLRIVGRDLPESYLQLFDSSVRYEKYVEDIRSVFSSSDILLAPIYVGGGTKYKILEAMASGVPVITTKKGAEGLSVIHTKELLIAEHVSDWSSSISQLINHPKLVFTISQQARVFVEKGFSWSHIANIQHEVWMNTYETA